METAKRLSIKNPWTWLVFLGLTAFSLNNTIAQNTPNTLPQRKEIDMWGKSSKELKETIQFPTIREVFNTLEKNTNIDFQTQPQGTNQNIKSMRFFILLKDGTKICMERVEDTKNGTVKDDIYIRNWEVTPERLAELIEYSRYYTYLREEKVSNGIVEWSLGKVYDIWETQ